MTCMFVCVRQVLDMQMIKRTFLPLTVKHADGVCMCGVCGCVVVCCVFELALNMSQCCLPSGKTKTEMKGESKGNMKCRKALFA